AAHRPRQCGVRLSRLRSIDHARDGAAGEAARRQGRGASFAAGHAGLRPPGNGDRAGRGGRSGDLSNRSVEGFLDSEGMPLNHIKPHGALYGMAAPDEAIAGAIANAARMFGVPVLGMAFTAQETAYRKKGVAMIGEFYGDLDYDGDGNLILSRVHDAVDPAQAAARVLRVMREHVVATTTGRDIPVRAETICVHSDTPAAVAIAAELAKTLRQHAA